MSDLLLRYEIEHKVLQNQNYTREGLFSYIRLTQAQQACFLILVFSSLCSAERDGKEIYEIDPHLEIELRLWRNSNGWDSGKKWILFSVTKN